MEKISKEDIKELKKLRSLYKEECLLKLTEYSLLLKEKDTNELVGVKEYIINKIIPIFEKIYEELNLEYNYDETTKEDFDIFKKQVNNFIGNNENHKNILLKLVEKREKYKNNSGAEAVKRLYEYQIKDFISKKNKIIDKLIESKDREKDLEKEILNVIQYEDEIIITEELLSTREKIRNYKINIEKIDQDIKNIEYLLEKKWYYEIFGTMSEDEIKASFFETFPFLNKSKLN